MGVECAWDKIGLVGTFSNHIQCPSGWDRLWEICWTYSELPEENSFQQTGIDLSAPKPSIVLALFLGIGSFFFLYMKARVGPGPYIFGTLFGCITIGMQHHLNLSCVQSLSLKLCRHLFIQCCLIPLPILSGTHSWPFVLENHFLSSGVDWAVRPCTSRYAQCGLDCVFNPDIPGNYQRSVYKASSSGVHSSGKGDPNAIATSREIPV